MNKGIVLEGISKQFSGFWVLNDIDAIIHPRRITAFVGPNGAGKTTLFNIIAGELSPDKGSVYFNGKDITNMFPYKIAKLGIGRQFQDVRVFENLSVVDNVALSLISKNGEGIMKSIKNIFKISKVINSYRERAMEFIKFVGLKEHYKKLAGELSFGQQKLLSFARLMAGDFNILLLDEPIAGVSHEMMEKILILLEYLVKEEGKTIALIEHNMEVVSEISDWVYFLDEGKVEFTGRADHVLDNPEVKEIYMGIYYE